MNLPLRTTAWLSRPIDAAGIAVFRMTFGAAMLWEVWHYMQHDWFRSLYFGPQIHLAFPGLSWIHDLPLPPVPVIEGGLLIGAVCIALGLLYRLGATAFFVLFSYTFLYEQTVFLNHFYLIALLSFLFIVIPMHRIFSIDALIGAVLARRGQTSRVLTWLFPSPNGPPPAPYVPAWTQALLIFQISIPYVYGGLAKLLTPDWLMGYPMRFWIYGRSDIPVFGPYMNEMWMALFMSHAGMIFDLGIIPLVLWRRTRWLGVALILAFNLTNSQLFHIGVFPWLMIGSIPLFFASDWPRIVWDLLTVSAADRRAQAKERHKERMTMNTTAISKRLTVFLAIYILFQVLFPLRHLLYSGNVQWTEEGGLFAWQMKLRDKRGAVSFRVLDRRTGNTITVDPRDYLAEEQKPAIATRPDLILQFAHFLRDRYSNGQPDQISVYADSLVSLNGRPLKRLIDPSIDLAREDMPLFGHARWILPLAEPLPDKPEALPEDGGDSAF